MRTTDTLVEMKERPILFSGPMVRAILEGRKTQTRRIVKPQPPKGYHIDTCQYNDTGWAFWVSANDHAGTCTCKNLRQPYGQPGDRLWVRETWAPAYRTYGYATKKAIAYRVDSDHDPHKWKPSIHMPRWASRITLKVVGVRVERLQECTRGDAMAEGCPFPNMAIGSDPRKWYAELWNSINGMGSWEANPWVWVVEFKVISQ
jgi:hypothetical protein